MKWSDIKQLKYQAYDFGPKTPEEEEVWDRETACVGMVYLRLLAAKDWLSLRARSVKLIYQRITQGFDDSVTWSLDIHLAGLILPRLKRFKELNTHAYPNGLTPEQWSEILDKMIYGFEFTVSDDKMFGKFDEEEYDKAKEGLRLFGEYFHALWD